MARDGKPVVIRVVKRAKHGGHHGGSWKVAYADFVTALMAFFLVMWIVGMDQSVKNAIEGYFSNPVGFRKGYSAGKSPISAGNSPGMVRTHPIRLVNRVGEELQLRAVGDRLKARLGNGSDLALTAVVEVIVTPTGLRVELIESNTGDTFFPVGSADLKPQGLYALQVIAYELRELSNPIIIEGHTDARPYGDDAARGNWELSADRANAARRVLLSAGIAPGRIAEVRALADRHLRVPDRPLDPSNRRISIILPFVSPQPTAEDSAAAEPASGTAVGATQGT